MFAQQYAGNVLNEALFAFSLKAAAKINPTDRFAHYTSADAALKIIGGDGDGKRALWLRNSKLMNDFTEVEWGQMCLGEAFKNRQLHDRFKRALDAIHPHLFEDIAATLIGDEKEIGERAHILSLALHTEIECQTGKLSMWRAYGGDDNVCLVFNTAPFLRRQGAYEFGLSPVMYGGPDEFSREFQGLIHRLEVNVPILSCIDFATLFANIMRALNFSLLSTKHSGFHEETEWRVIHQHSGIRPDPPFIIDPTDASKRIYQLPLKNLPEAGLWGAEIDEALDHIILGPAKDFSTVPDMIMRWTDILSAAGLPDPERRVIFCGIPFRR